jgi:hypothetical protein
MVRDQLRHLRSQFTLYEKVEGMAVTLGDLWGALDKRRRRVRIVPRALQ